MRTPCLIEASCDGERVFFNPSYIEALVPGTLRDASKDLTVIRFNSGMELVINRPLDEVLCLIAEETKPEDEL
jgi:hypothetical protein